MHSITYIAAEAYISIENRIINEYKQSGTEYTQTELAKAVDKAIGIMGEINEAHKQVDDFIKWQIALAPNEKVVTKEL